MSKSMEVTEQEVGSTPQDAVYAYLNKKYPAESAEGFRQGLYAAAWDIADTLYSLIKIREKYQNSPRMTKHFQLPPLAGPVMREAWEGCHPGTKNIVIRALQDAAPGRYPCGKTLADMVEEVTMLQGFFTPQELQQSDQLSGCTLYRGCSSKEGNTEKGKLGFSWTLDKGIAEAFARLQKGVVLVATLPPRSGAVWLDSGEDTGESEVIWPRSDVTFVTSRSTVYSEGETRFQGRKQITPAAARASMRMRAA